jgi:anti-anti-sigma factor
MDDMKDLSDAPDGEPFSVDVSDEPGGTVVVAVRGELDIATAPELRAALASVDGRASQLVFDLHAVDFMDSSGISVLLAARVGDELIRLRAPSEAVTRLLDVTGLTEVFGIES